MTVHLPRPGRAVPAARKVLIMGDGAAYGRLSPDLESGGLRVVGYVDDRPDPVPGWLGHIADLGRVCAGVPVDAVAVALSTAGPLAAPPTPRRRDDPEPPGDRHVLVPVPGSRALRLRARTGRFPRRRAAFGPTGWRRRAKRAVDVAGAGVLLVALSPLLAAIAVAVAVTSPGPVLFRQPRVGHRGRVFSMYKFRSMRCHGVVAAAVGERSAGPFPKLKRDPRVTPVGRVMRRLSIDELPQLVNVLRGEMSLVGPRPYVVEDAALINGWAAVRQSVLPGITGLWQVSGRNDLTFDDMCRLDHLYVSCWSLRLDVQILGRTLTAVLRRRGAY